MNDENKQIQANSTALIFFPLEFKNKVTNMKWSIFCAGGFPQVLGTLNEMTIFMHKTKNVWI